MLLTFLWSFGTTKSTNVPAEQHMHVLYCHVFYKLFVVNSNTDRGIFVVKDTISVLYCGPNVM